MSPSSSSGRGTELSRIELALQPRHLLAQWQRCGLTADWLASYLACDLETGEQASAKNVLSTVINELLENAVKFSADGVDTFKVAVRREHRIVRVETWNRAVEHRSRLLEQTLAELEVDSAQALFLRRMAQPAVVGAPGIGIIVVRRDYGARIHASVTPADSGTTDVHVSVDLELPGPA